MNDTVSNGTARNDTARNDTVWFVTGASRGFGRDIVRHALDRGDRVVATARRPDSLLEAFPDAGSALLPLRLDVNDADEVSAAVAAAVERFGRIDILVNNAGRGLLGAVEELSDAEVRQVFDVNVFGLLNVTRAVLPVMRTLRSGKIINISSSGGFNGSPGWGVYCATKFAVEGVSEALRHEVRPLGIEVTAIEPGGFRTDFLDGSSLGRSATLIEDYLPTVGAMRQWADESNFAQPGDPAKAAAVIVALADRAELPERLQLGIDSFNGVAEKLERVAAEQAEWREVSVSTGHDDEPVVS
jgi:NAD(P)-dependent dehydrogenase (short-subunit alcohol dehydrogenase family)